MGHYSTYLFTQANNSGVQRKLGYIICSEFLCDLLFICPNCSLFMKVTNIKTPQTQEDEFIEIQSDTGTAFQRWTVRHMTMLQQVCESLPHHTATEQNMYKEWKLNLTFVFLKLNVFKVVALFLFFFNHPLSPADLTCLSLSLSLRWWLT